MTLLLAWGLLPAHATDWVGGDWGGGSLYTAHGDTLTGVFTDVHRFVVPPGASVRVEGSVEVYATIIEIDGVLDASGAGAPGGAGAPPGAVLAGETGYGVAPGFGGSPGPCSHGGGGGGGGNGGNGGNGGYLFAGGAAGGPGRVALPGPGGFLGSGGGGGGSDCYYPGADGGAGGGNILLSTGTLVLDGRLQSDGEDGDDHALASSGGGGGGSGGNIVVFSSAWEGDGEIWARGGDGGDGGIPGTGGWGGGGGGGGGGRLWVEWAVRRGTLAFDVARGTRGTDQEFSLMAPSRDGSGGSIHQTLAPVDADADGVHVPVDNCPLVPNPSQLDTDGDGQGDRCDPCPLDNPDDTDRDDVCDSVDQCPLGDDELDSDADGVPDACDGCPFDALGDTDGDGVCDSTDACPGQDDSLDADGDGVPDGCDICPDDPDPEQLDTDGDGLGDGCDCGPNDPEQGPNAVEVCDGLDNDCDGEVDELGAEGGSLFYADADGDGQGDPRNAIDACDVPPGYVDNALDCDDTNRVVLMFARELCDGLDNDCDGEIEPAALCPTDDPAAGRQGCGCASSPRPVGLLWLLTALGSIRRRHAP